MSRQVESLSQVRARLLALLREKSLKIGHFKLVSGQTSHYYFDSKLTTLDPEGSFLTAWLILESLREANIQAAAIGGMTLGADPIVSAVAAVSYAYPNRFRPLAAFIVRKEAKKHGTEQFLEGPAVEPDSKVVVVDDVCTTGGSTLKAIERSEAAGLEVVAVLALVDRRQGGAETLSGYPFFPLFGADELLDDPTIQKRISALE